jgi:hypothetical protein
MSLPSGPFTWPTRRIVSAVRCESSAWHREPKAIERAASAPCAVFCRHLHLCVLNASQSCSDQSAGSMWPVERFAAPGPLIGAGNTSKSFRFLTSRRAFRLPFAHRVRCARITAGVGKIGSPAMPGRGHRSLALRLLAFLPSSPATKTGGTGTPRSVFDHGSSPL